MRTATKTASTGTTITFGGIVIDFLVDCFARDAATLRGVPA